MTAGAAGVRSVRHGPVARQLSVRLVVTQVAAVAVLIGALAGTGTLAVGVAGAIVLLSLVWLRPRGRWAYAWLATALRYASRRHTVPPGGPASLIAFVAPDARVTATGPPGEELAVIADGHGMTAVLEVGDPAGLLVEDLPPLPRLASLLPPPAASSRVSGPDAEHPPVRVQLVLTGAPAPAARAGSGPPAMSYRQLTEGRLPAYGRALLAVRVLRSEEWTDDDLRRALAGLVRRLPRRLGRLPARPLGAIATMRAIAELAHDDGRTPPHESWAALRIGGLAQAGFRLERLPDQRAEASRRLITGMLATPATATTVALTAGPDPETATIHIRVAAPDSAGLAVAAHALRRLVSAEHGHLRRLDGDQLDGLAATLPLGGERRPDVPGRVTRAGFRTGVLDGLDMPTGDAGLMLGRDRHGRPVVARLFRPEETRAMLVGGIRCAQLVALRAMATGARVVVQTVRPGAWEPFVRGATGPGESITIVPSGRTIEIQPGSALAPLLAVVDVGAAGVDERPGFGWQATLTVRDEITSADVGPASRADFLILQRLREEEADQLRDALGLGDAAEWFAKIRPDMVGLVNRQAVRWAVLAQTPIELQLIGSAVRGT